MYQLTGNKRRIFSILKKAAAVLLILVLMSSTAYAGTGVQDEARQIIKNYFVNDVPPSIDTASSIKDMVDALGDVHSQYFTKAEYEDFVNGINNNFSGIGVHIDMAPLGVKVISVIDNSPAYKAGFMEGDIIIEADGHVLAGLSTEEAVSYIKGETGTTVHLKVKRGDAVNTYDVVRAVITDTTVAGKMLKNKAAYINVSSFGEKTSEEFGAELEKLKKENPDGYIIDLRNNPGGFLNTAISMAGYFIKGQPALLTRDRFDEENTYYASSSVDKIDKPVVFLINEYSASASEILSGAVKDYKAAFIVGSNSYGKGSVQSMFPLSDGSVLKLTVMKFFSPLGNTIDKVGIAPDLNSLEADPEAIAELLLSTSSGRMDRRGYLKLTLGGREFEIDLKLARLPGYLEAFNRIIDSASDIKVGTIDGWDNISVSIPSDRWNALYPGFQKLANLDEVPVDKKFTIKFSSPVDAGSIKSDDIELVDATTGERVPLSFENVGDSDIKATPEKSLTLGASYYILVNDSIRSKDMQAMSTGVISLVTVQR